MAHSIYINQYGPFTVKEPFKTDIYTLNYTVTQLAVLTLEQKESLYKRNGLSDNDFQQAHLNKVRIVTLSSDNDILIIPEDYITKAPVNRWVDYGQLHVGITLSSIPVEEDLTAFKQALIDLSIRHLGLTGEPFIVPHGTKQVISEIMHGRLVEERNSRMAVEATASTDPDIINLELEQCRTKIKQLEEVIRTQTELYGIVQ